MPRLWPNSKPVTKYKPCFALTDTTVFGDRNWSTNIGVRTSFCVMQREISLTQCTWTLTCSDLEKWILDIAVVPKSDLQISAEETKSRIWIWENHEEAMCNLICKKTSHALIYYWFCPWHHPWKVCLETSAPKGRNINQIFCPFFANALQIKCTSREKTIIQRCGGSGAERSWVIFSICFDFCFIQFLFCCSDVIICNH